MLRDIFESKKFWIILMIILAIWIVYRAFSAPDRTMTPSEIRESTRKCQEWGGTPSYDNGEYSGCLGGNGVPID